MHATVTARSEHGGDALFSYDSRKWIYNESLRQAERYLKFDVQQLKHVAATSVGRTKADVIDIHKLGEGGFNRAFEITLRDGLQLVARLPYSSTVPKHYATASEVATMDLVRCHGIPVPEIYQYSATSENPVGAEYIIMAKVGGKALVNYWWRLTPGEIMKIVTQIVEMEATLFSINLPASGSIYYTTDLDPAVEREAIDGKGKFGDFCVGPDAHYGWWHGERASLPLDRKAFRRPEDALRAVGMRELIWTKQRARPQFPSECLYRQIHGYQKSSPTEHIATLSDYLRIADFLLPKEPRLTRHVIRHPDLQPSNIFVTESMDLLGVIDWQHCSILPLFLHAGIPEYLQNYDDQGSNELVPPRLPEKFDELSIEDQNAARDLHRRQLLHFAYVGRTLQMNEDHFDACRLDDIVLRKRLFQGARCPWDGNTVTLKADLIRATQEWPALTSTFGEKDLDCPITYSEEEVEKILELDKKQREIDDFVSNVRRFLGIDSQGAVPAEHYDEAKELAKKLKADAIEAAETDMAKEDLQHHFPFDDHDESGMT
ncbi:MAG: hypothetical protein Q9166_006721 [cf. Caloplaca sp. 2 TL-2023]